MKIIDIKSLGPLLAAASLFTSPLVYADDADDVMAAVQKWADTEQDLVEQAKLIRSDRVMITAGGRQSNQADNLKVQLAGYNARVKVAGGEPQMFVRIESPQVAVYGNAAVVSFVRVFNVIPYNQIPNPTGRSWFSLVLVKEGGDWGIAHSHVTQIGN